MSNLAEAKSISRLLLHTCKSEHLQTNAKLANSNLPISLQFSSNNQIPVLHFQVIFGNSSLVHRLFFISFSKVKSPSTFRCGTSRKKNSSATEQTKDFRDEWAILLSEREKCMKTVKWKITMFLGSFSPYLSACMQYTTLGMFLRSYTSVVSG